MEYATDFYKPNGPRLTIGPVYARKSIGLAVGTDGSPSHKVVAYFRSEEAAEECKQVLRELFKGRLLVDDEEA